MAEPLRIGIAGLGTVGASLVRLLARNADALQARCGRPLVVHGRFGARPRPRPRRRSLRL